MEIKGPKNIIWHVLGVLAFLSLPIVISPRPPGEEARLLSHPAIRDFVADVLMVILFYANYYLFIPRYYLQKKYFIYGAIIFCSLLIIAVLPSIITGYVPLAEMRPPRPPGGMRNFVPRQISIIGYLNMISHNILLFSSVVLFSIFLRIREQLYKIEKVKNKMELGTLKSQINPHFLFNTLNGIYALSLREKAKLTSENILKLSGLMRYVVTEAEADFVPIQKELKYIDDYILLQKLRLGDQIPVNYQQQGNPASLRIVPLILFPFIENAFKHGVNPEENSKIDISVKFDKALLTLVVINNKVLVQQNEHERSGTGIENAKLRLQLLYPGEHKLLILDDRDTFKVDLQINLDD